MTGIRSEAKQGYEAQIPMVSPTRIDLFRVIHASFEAEEGRNFIL
jgi:hypothetical protein